MDRRHKIVYFGAWEHEIDHSGAELIFSLDWEFNEKRHRAKGFKESSENIDLILSEKYKLMTFTQVAKNSLTSPIRIKRIIPTVRERQLTNIDSRYFAHPESLSAPAPNAIEQKYIEGARKIVVQSLRERNPAARKKCLELYGFSCRVCEFDFEKTYGAVGRYYIHVHHLEMIAKKDGAYNVDPAKDLRPVCPNCHAMIHKHSTPIEINVMRRLIGKSELQNP